MTQEDEDYTGEDAGFSVAVLHVPHSPSRTRGSASAGPTIVIDRQPSISLSLTSPHKHSARRRANAPTITLPDRSFHSPETSQIVGTPYATDSGPFEYPFPENTHPYMHPDLSSRSVSIASSVHTSPALGSVPPLCVSTYPHVSASTSPMMMPGHHQSGYSPPFSSSGSSSTSSSIASSTSSFASVPLTHSTLKAPPHPNPPPMPPSLAKKRPKWSLGMIGRRRSGFEGDPDDGLDDKYEYDVSMPHRDDKGRGEH